MRGSSFESDSDQGSLDVHDLSGDSGDIGFADSDCWPRSRTEISICDGVKMTEGQHPAALEHMPWFISGPYEGDPLYVITTVCVIAAIVALGILFFTLHSLPERLGHKKMQFEVVAVLGLLSLFTHVHAFWVAGLLLALIDLPDFVGPWKRMATSLEKMSGVEPPPEDAVQPGLSGSETRPVPSSAAAQPQGT
jgi:hypothetical protein